MANEFIPWLDAQILMSGQTKRQLAERAGLSTTTLYQVTAYDRPPTADFCVRIAYALGLPTTLVLRRAGFPVIQAPPELPGWEGEAWAVIQQIPERHRETVLVMLRALASHQV